MVYFLSVLGIMLLLGIAVAIYEAKHAILVDEKEPFLHGDYDPMKDSTLQKESDTVG